MIRRKSRPSLSPKDKDCSEPIPQKAGLKGGWEPIGNCIISNIMLSYFAGSERDPTSSSNKILSWLSCKEYASGLPSEPGGNQNFHMPKREAEINQPVRTSSRTSDNLSKMTILFRVKRSKQRRQRFPGGWLVSSQAPAWSSYTFSRPFPHSGSSSFPTFLPGGLIRAEVILINQGIRDKLNHLPRDLWTEDYLMGKSHLS